MARKRKIEGEIQVSFTLLPNGDIKNLMINGKRSILKKATKNAIDYALPMDIKFYMNYFLK
ncbi:MAG: energy transducer TonB [Thiohalomonas sp.]|nr:energy transducer TonB [Thiohalomonas sp.]